MTSVTWRCLTVGTLVAVMSLFAIHEFRRMNASYEMIQTPTSNDGTSLKPDVNPQTSQTRSTNLLPTRDRVAYLHKMCRKLPKKSIYKISRASIEKNKLLTFYIYPKMKMAYCPIRKIAMYTFVNLYGKPNRKFHSISNHMMLRSQHYTKVIFVREPFARLLSAYMDKFYLYKGPFQDTAQRILRLAGREHKITPSNCHRDVTFRDFIKYVLLSVKSGGTIGVPEMHWYPHSILCSPCHVHYDFIGKLETSTEDMETLWKIIKSDVQLVKTQKNLTENRNYRDIERVFLIQCFPLRIGLAKAWMDLQIRGEISHKAKFPFDQIKHGVFTFEQVWAKIKEVTDKIPVNRVDKSHLRTVTLRAAYGTLDQSDIDRIRRLYHADFVLYGYSKYPDFLKPGPITYQSWTPFKI